MMIALAILGMGLLVIGAALPVGITYTRDSINMATGEAAAEYALDVIEQSVSLPRHIFRDNIVANGQEREAALFQPRQTDPANALYAPYLPGQFVPTYEPIIKVRPLCTQNVRRTPGASGAQLPTVDAWVGEQAVHYWLSAVGATLSTQECDETYSFAVRHVIWPALPSVAICYPPIMTLLPPNDPYWANAPYSPSRFLQSSGYLSWPVTIAEVAQVLDRRTVWSAFYRRVSYGAGSDPDLYEFITVVSRLPSARHRFPVQNPNTGVYWNDDTAAPIPWLVTFASLPFPTGSPAFDPATGFPNFVSGAPPATLTFTIPLPAIAPHMSGLFPVGSIFIPARNDSDPTNNGAHVAANLRVGFSPPAPTILPIYEVVQRPDDVTVVTKFNGYYPMQGTPGGTLQTPAAGLWPVWVIPPAYEDLSGGNPVFPNRSTIVAVARRYVRLREIP